MTEQDSSRTSLADKGSFAADNRSKGFFNVNKVNFTPLITDSKHIDVDYLSYTANNFIIRIMESYESRRQPEVDLEPLEERLTEHMERSEHNPLQKLDFDCAMLATVFGRLSKGSTAGDIEDIHELIDNADRSNLFYSSNTSLVLRGSYSKEFGVDHDSLIKCLKEQITLYHMKSGGELPSIPADTLLNCANMKWKLTTETRSEILTTLAHIYDDETAKTAFMYLADDLIRILRNGVPGQQRWILPMAKALMAAVKPRQRRLLATEYGDVFLDKFNELSKAASRVEKELAGEKSSGITKIYIHKGRKYEVEDIDTELL